MPLVQHAEFLLCGLIVVLVVLHIPYKWFQLFPVILIPLSLGMLVYALIVRHGINDASRWVSILGIQFQPSELAKMAMIIFSASVLSKTQTVDGASPNAFKIIFSMLVLFCALIFPENFSTSALLFVVIMLMMFIGRVSAKYLLISVGSIVMMVILLLLFVEAMPANNNPNDRSILHRAQLWVTRIENFCSDRDEVPAVKYDINNNEQVGHARIAVATSGIFGKAPGNSVQRDFLSEAASDFIFAIIIEELGLAGGILIVFLYICLLFRAGKIAKKCDFTFPGLLILGIALMITIQALTNMMVAVGLFPVTGQPLPLISKGGTSTLINCTYIGIMLSVSCYVESLDKSRRKKKDEEEAELEIHPEEPEAELLNEDTKMK